MTLDELEKLLTAHNDAITILTNGLARIEAMVENIWVMVQQNTK